MGDDIQTYLRNGWELSGYSTTVMAMGAMTHSVLLRKEFQLVSIVTVTNNGKIVGTSAVRLA